MQLNKARLLLLALVAITVVALTVAGYKSSTVKSEAVSGQAVQAVDIASMVQAEVNQLPDSLKAQMNKLGNSKSDLQQTLVLWDSLGRTLPSAYTMWKLAETDPSPSNWMIAGSKYYNVALMSSDSMIALEAGNQARMAFEKVLAQDAGNLDAKTALAACYVDIDKDIMKGVGLLKEVIAVDSNNIQALFTLGLLSVQSGQLDKAKQRFEKLVAIQPFNPEFYYYLGEVYAKSGEVNEAIRCYEKCKTLLKDEAAKQEVEQLIHKLKTI